MPSLLDVLTRERLLKDREAALEVVSREEPPQVSLLRLCDAGLLMGGLTVAYDVRPDELMGPLTLAMGGSARTLKVVDVRERPVLELHVQYGERTERWEVEDLSVLVHNLNDLYRDDPSVRAVAELGEWQDALQLWCLDKSLLPRLARQPFFAPRNARALTHPGK
ncbi:hypothetical protein LZ198_05675 [Myxococcus sp. K15C18031901]|uniref:hypothetical protein n=1 Tax=Myxococcus dinghuensis TaxID=2906761 RepID=UPI0020A7A6A2|nr:hypothetical protein [Myxococcus dinghuensis]MCP3098368.1 hypothetical protein [Myxococcus dinghuensis]